LLTRKPKKLVEGLNIYITKLDFYRVPVTWGLLPLPFRVYMGFKLMSEYHFRGHNKDLYRKTRKDLDPFYKELKNYIRNGSVILYVSTFLWMPFR
jgi:hypothetical protein